jgi:hypothetical protein
LLAINEVDRNLTYPAALLHRGMKQRNLKGITLNTQIAEIYTPQQ